MATTQNRIMRTYEVNLIPFDMDEEEVTVEVNLSYELDGLNAIDLHGHVIKPDDVRAQVEAINRLRRLAERGKVDIDPETIERSEWDVHLVRHSLVRVELDDNGKPIRRS